MATDREHVIIVGCGRVGSALARHAAAAGHTAAVIDRRPQAFDRFLADWDGTKIVGTGFDRDRLEAAGIGTATAVAAVTSGDNSNIIVARVARENYGIDRVVARIYDTRRAALYARLGIPTIATVPWTVHEAAHVLFPETGREADWVDPSDALRIVRHRADASLAGTTLASLESPPARRVLAVNRAGETLLLPPTALVQDGDELVLAVSPDGIEGLTTRESA